MKCFPIFGLLATTFALTGCLYGQCMNGPCALEHSKIVKSIKPYGAHWVKDEMTRESRRGDFVRCGGGTDLRQGYEVLPNQSNQDFFAAFNAHTHKLLNCMKSSGYVYQTQCDARCLHP